jgi:hypothetical protein
MRFDTTSETILGPMTTYYVFHIVYSSTHRKLKCTAVHLVQHGNWCRGRIDTGLLYLRGLCGTGEKILAESNSLEKNQKHG